MDTMNDAIDIYTDGSCSVENKGGGWAFVARVDGRQMTGCGYQSDTTVNKMELRAIQKALECVSLNERPLSIYTDSQYARKCLSVWHIKWAANGWLTANGEAVKNSEEIQECLRLLVEHRKHRQVTIHWVKGHSGHTHNEYADKLAHQARINQLPQTVTVR